MRYAVLALIILLTLLFSAWCGSWANAATSPWWREYCLRHWLEVVELEVSMPIVSDPNGPAPDMKDANNWVMETKQVRINLPVFFDPNNLYQPEFRNRLHPANRSGKYCPLVCFKKENP